MSNQSTILPAPPSGKLKSRTNSRNSGGFVSLAITPDEGVDDHEQFNSQIESNIMSSWWRREGSSGSDWKV
jgi:hypothetical protein